MINEDYVSYEVAKLLKEKGFQQDYYTYPAYWMNGNIPTLSFMDDDVFPYSQDDCVAPSLTNVMKWLREEHSLCIEPYRTACGYFYTISTIPYGSCKCNPTEGGDDENSGQWTTYEGVCEAAIKYCLENLI